MVNLILTERRELSVLTCLLVYMFDSNTYQAVWLSLNYKQGCCRTKILFCSLTF